MADAARLVESPAYYHRLIDFCADWGLNAIVFRLTDDQGCSMRFASHPELVTHANALTPDQMRELAQHGQTRGVELIPEIESFGHATCITTAYPELADTDPAKHFTGLIPIHPRSLEIVTDLYREAASIFPSRYLHGGCDEVNWGFSEMSREALKTRSRAQVWGEYLNKLNAAARGCGKELIVWADHVLRKESGILELLDKAIILHDWCYWDNEQGELHGHAKAAMDAGHRVLGGPALNWCRWGPRIGTPQLRNVESFAEVYRRFEDARCMGVLVTQWVPGRYLPGSMWDGVAYAGVALNEGAAPARAHAMQRFVERHYGALWNDTWADVLASVYDLAPPRAQCAPGWMAPTLPVPWKSEEDLRGVVARGDAARPAFTRVLSQLAVCRQEVRRNLNDFEDFVLSIEYLEHLHWRDRVLLEASRAPTADGVALVSLIAQRDARLLSRLDAEWDRHRPATSPSKTQAFPFMHPEDQLHFTFREAAVFSAELAREPARCERLLRGG